MCNSKTILYYGLVILFCPLVAFGHGKEKHKDKEEQKVDSITILEWVDASISKLRLEQAQE